MELTYLQIHLSHALPVPDYTTEHTAINVYTTTFLQSDVTVTVTDCTSTTHTQYSEFAPVTALRVAALDSYRGLEPPPGLLAYQLPNPASSGSVEEPAARAEAATVVLETEVPDSAGRSGYGLPYYGPITTPIIWSSLPVQSASVTVESGTTGSIHSTLDTTEPVPLPPPVTSTPTETLSAIPTTELTSRILSTATAAASGNIFVPIASDAPVVPSRGDHPVSRERIANQANRLQTNKFYANLFLGNQSCGAWTHPYSVSWVRGGGNASSWGLGVSHIERSQLALGPVEQPQNAVRYFINPIGIHSIILSASELSNDTSLTVDSLEAFSVNANFAPYAGAASVIKFPLVQGMGFVTGLYNSGTPLIQSSVYFRTFEQVGALDGSSTRKLKIVLEDGTNWLVYVSPSSCGPISFSMTSNTTIQGPSNFSGFIQLAKNNQGSDGEAVYDQAAGAYPTSASISASVDGNNGRYSFSWSKAGNQSRTLLMHALPHHMQSFDDVTLNAQTRIQLQTTTKGMATGVLADSWTLFENLPADIGFAPWSPERGSVTTLSSAAISAINASAATELAQDMNSQCNLNSMYFSGKALAKFASILYTTHDLASNPGLAAAGLQKLQSVFATFVDNRQINPLVYDDVWGGVVSTAGLQGDPGQDFGNSWYNDHHFHYGYFVYAAAVIGYLDPAWLEQQQGRNRAWVNMLVRDFANSVDDAVFPFSRGFDWWHGHSWAKGLFESADGKDEESTSEDVFASYAVMMWGKVVGDANMEARGKLMLAIQKRSAQSYFLMESSNKIQPSEFIGNKVTGILFENKADHATYFGLNPEYIQGIHMIPINPSTAFVRTKNFVNEEWNTYFSNGRVDQISGGWRGLLYSNLAIIDPQSSYNFFNQDNFEPSWLDGGASRTWYLAYAAALGGGTQY